MRQVAAFAAILCLVSNFAWVTLAEPLDGPSSTQGAQENTAPKAPGAAAKSDRWIGMKVENYRDDIRVTGIVPEGPGERAGMRVGDRILQLDGNDVRDVVEFIRGISSTAADASRTLGIVRDGQSLSVVVRPDLKPDEPTLVARLKQLADEGNANAQFQLGMMYDGTASEAYRLAMPEAIAWLKRAADGGIAGAQSELGSFYLKGEHLPADLPTGVELTRKAAGQGHITAIRNMSVIYRVGLGVEKDEAESRRWHDMAYASGNLMAILDRASFYGNGELFPKDLERAAECYHIAASRGSIPGAYQFGRCLLRGIGVPRDANEARRWLARASEMGNADATAELAALDAKSSSPETPGGGAGANPADLGSAARAAQRAVVLLVAPGAGSGTGFVISQEHRLIATNAHVADLFFAGGQKKMTAKINEVGTTHEVDKVWYHPGVLRCIDMDNVAIVRSMEPSHGATFPGCPDVAVLQLKDTGPPLPAELTLGTPQELRELLGQPIGLLGFPGHDREGTAEGLEDATASYQQGVVSRLTDFQMKGSVPESRRQYLQHTAMGLNGASGSPLFLANGHVIALHNSFRTAQTSQYLTQLSHGIRVDCLWELLAYHNLHNLVAVPVGRDEMDLARFDRPDESLEKFRKVWTYLVEADRLMNQRKYSEAAKVCKKAIDLAPDYAYCYAVRQEAFMGYAADYQESLSVETIVQQTQYALDDAKKYAELLPSAPNAILRYALALNNRGVAEARLAGDDSAGVPKYREAIAICNEVLQSGPLTDQCLAEAYATRGVALQGLRRFDESLTDVNEAIRLLPNSPAVYYQRARLRDVRGEAGEAQADRAKGDQLRNQLIQGNP